MGFPVTFLTDKAAPPRESPSVFVRIIPVNGKASLKDLAVITASCPIILSTINNVSCGDKASCNPDISFIIAASIVRRPAVSTIKTSSCARRDAS